jgi:hypothetical protein
VLDAFLLLGLDVMQSLEQKMVGHEMLARVPTIKSKGRKWKVWVVDETDVTITVRVRPLRVMKPVEFTFPFRNEFRSFDDLAAEAIDRYLEAQASSKRSSPPLHLRRPWHSTNGANYAGSPEFVSFVPSVQVRGLDRANQTGS